MVVRTDETLSGLLSKDLCVTDDGKGCRPTYMKEGRKGWRETERRSLSRHLIIFDTSRWLCATIGWWRRRRPLLVIMTTGNDECFGPEEPQVWIIYTHETIFSHRNQTSLSLWPVFIFILFSLSPSLPLCPSIRLSVCPSACLHVWLSVYLSISLSIYLSIYLSI